MRRKPLFFIFFLLAVFALGSVLLLSNKINHPTPSIQKTLPSSIQQDSVVTSFPEILPPLYSGIVWNKPNVGSFRSFTNQSSQPNPSDITTLGQNADQFYYVISQPIHAQVRQSIVTYYEQWFVQYQWKEDVIADGPTGSTIGFIKNNNRFLVNFSYLPQNTAQYTVSIEHN